MSNQQETTRRVIVRCVLLVALDPDKSARCTDALAKMEIVALSVGPAVAAERITEEMPLAVVIDETLEPHWRAPVSEAAAAVGAELLTITSTGPDAAMLAWQFSVALDRDRNNEPDAP
jgi:hypothetical protein